MSSYKLTYFDFTWLGEPIRFLLKYKGIDFVDVRHDYNNFAPFKKNYPIQLLPVLEIDGLVLHQSNAIARYLANEYGLTGSSNLEKVQADMAVDTIVDLRNILEPLFQEPDLEKRKVMAAELLAGKSGIFLNYLNKTVIENGGYFVNGKLTWADIFLAATFDVFVKYYGASAIDKYPELKHLNEKVRSIPNIKKWIETRPKTEE